jgi:DNA-binding NarL/FixJ family response regulator
MITIVLADDHHVVRQGLRALLEAEVDFSVVGEMADGLKVADLVKETGPKVLIVDLMMPGLNGLDITRQVSLDSPKTRVVILSMHANEAYVLEALKNGAMGYVLKDSQATHLIKAVREAVAGRRYLSPPLSEEGLDIYLKKTADTALDLYQTLTSREREVLHLVAEGYTNTEIADRLVISHRTVETHRSNLMRKLKLRTSADLVRYALQRGILPMDD